MQIIQFSFEPYNTFLKTMKITLKALAKFASESLLKKKTNKTL